MDASTIEFGRECPDCLRWSVPIREDDKCPHCINHGCPENPNRVRYLAVKDGMTLREVGRKAKLTWRTIRLVSQGKIFPRKETEKKILKALNIPTYKKNIRYVFPNSRNV